MEALLAFIMNPVIFATIMSGITLGVSKWVENKLSARKEKQEAERIRQEKEKNEQDHGNQFRTELREEIKTLREELRRAEADADEWRSKYYTYVEQFIKVKAELDQALFKIKEEAEEASKLTGE